MVEMNPIKLFGLNNINGAQVVQVITTIVGVLLLCAAAVGIAWWYYSRKKFSKKITVFEIVGSNFSPVYRDAAKVVKLGKGGFEVLFLRKAKTWKLAYGGRIGKDTYYFFIMKDGYWYNGMLAADMQEITKQGGLIPIVTTNPTMRAQYTALEKQIEALHAQKKGIWEQYGTWILSAGFMSILGLFAWLISKEVSPFMGSLTELGKSMTELAGTMREIAIHLSNSCGGGSGISNAG